MVKIVFHPDLLVHTHGVKETRLSVANYRECIKKLEETYPGLGSGVLNQYMVSIDGAIIPSPFLESLETESELAFIKKIKAG